MKLLEVLKPRLKQKLMEGQADKLIDDGLSMIHNALIVKSDLPIEVNQHLLGALKMFKDSYYHGDRIRLRPLPNTWKLFHAKAYVSMAVEHVLDVVLSDDDYLNIEPRIMAKLEHKKQMIAGAAIDTVTLVESLLHLHGLEYPPIQNYNPLDRLHELGSTDHVLHELGELEDEYTENQEKMERFIEVTGDEKWILEVGEYKWLAFDDYCSRVDGEAMRHCGNTPGSRSDRVFTLNSFEEIDGVLYRKPHVFVVLEEGGWVGEMKGWGNSKPKEEYHRALVELLKQDFIKGIVTGRYAPQNDFSIEDLSEDMYEELKKSRGQRLSRIAGNDSWLWVPDND